MSLLRGKTRPSGPEGPGSSPRSLLTSALFGAREVADGVAAPLRQPGEPCPPGVCPSRLKRPRHGHEAQALSRGGNRGGVKCETPPVPCPGLARDRAGCPRPQAARPLPLPGGRPLSCRGRVRPPPVTHPLRGAPPQGGDLRQLPLLSPQRPKPAPPWACFPGAQAGRPDHRA